MRCWLAQFHPEPCDGPMQRCHLIPQQRLKAEYRLRGYEAALIEALVWDPRIVVPGCQLHHHAFDYGRAIELEEHHYPRGVHEYADEFGWFFAGADRGWLPLAPSNRRKEVAHL